MMWGVGSFLKQTPSCSGFYFDVFCLLDALNVFRDDGDDVGRRELFKTNSFLFRFLF